MQQQIDFNTSLSNILTGKKEKASVKQQMEAREITTEAIKKGVCEALEMDEAIIFSSTRKKEIVFARYLILFLCRKLTSMSLNKIGNEFGRDHSTVSQAYKNISKNIIADDRIKNIVDALINKFSTV